MSETLFNSFLYQMLGQAGEYYAGLMKDPKASPQMKGAMERTVAHIEFLRHQIRRLHDGEEPRALLGAKVRPLLVDGLECSFGGAVDDGNLYGVIGDVYGFVHDPQAAGYEDKDGRVGDHLETDMGFNFSVLEAAFDDREEESDDTG